MAHPISLAPRPTGSAHGDSFDIRAQPGDAADRAEGPVGVDSELEDCAAAGARFCVEVLPVRRGGQVDGSGSGLGRNWRFLVAAAAGLPAFAAWQARARQPLLPSRVVLNRNRGGAYLAMLFVSAGVFGIFLFLAFYLQTTLGYSPLVTGLAFLPFPAAVVASVNAGQIVLMPRTGPKPLIGLGLLIAAGGTAWLTRIGVHSGYVPAVLGPLIVTGLGIGQVTAPAVNTGTYGGLPPEPGDHPRRSPQRGAGPAVARARLHGGLLVDGGHLRRRRRGVRDAAAARVAAPTAGTRRHRRRTSSCPLRTTVRSAQGSLIRAPLRGRNAAERG